jgi:hypothetical protein
VACVPACLPAWQPAFDAVCAVVQIEQTWFGGDWSAVPTSQLLQPVWSQVYTMQVAARCSAPSATA